MGLGDLPTVYRWCSRDDPHRQRPVRVHTLQDRCKRLEIWALQLQEFRFTIQPRPGAQQTHVDALSRAPVPAESDQRPIALYEFPERMVLLVQAWDERVVALPTPLGPGKSERFGRAHTPCTPIQRLAEEAHAQHRGLHRQRGALRHV